MYLAEYYKESVKGVSCIKNIYIILHIYLRGKQGEIEERKGEEEEEKERDLFLFHFQKFPCNIWNWAWAMPGGRNSIQIFHWSGRFPLSTACKEPVSWNLELRAEPGLKPRNSYKECQHTKQHQQSSQFLQLQWTRKTSQREQESWDQLNPVQSVICQYLFPIDLLVSHVVQINYCTYFSWLEMKCFILKFIISLNNHKKSVFEHNCPIFG